jgi:hypothetical protein
VTDATTADDDRAGTAARMRAIAAALTAAGLDAHVHETRGVLDITATWHRPGSKPVEIIYDEDDYAQISYWSAPGATPTQIVAIISQALSAITNPP